MAFWAQRDALKRRIQLKYFIAFAFKWWDTVRNPRLLRQAKITS